MHIWADFARLYYRNHYPSRVMSPSDRHGRDCHHGVSRSELSIMFASHKCLSPRTQWQARDISSMTDVARDILVWRGWSQLPAFLFRLGQVGMGATTNIPTVCCHGIR